MRSLSASNLLKNASSWQRQDQWTSSSGGTVMHLLLRLIVPPLHNPQDVYNLSIHSVCYAKVVFGRPRHGADDLIVSNVKCAAGCCRGQRNDLTNGKGPKQ